MAAPLEAVSDPAALAREAERILAERRFHPRRTPAPFRGVLRWLGETLEPLADAIGWLSSPFFDAFDSVWSSTAGKLVIVAVFVAAGVAIAQAIATRRTVAALGPSHRSATVPIDDPAALEAAAADAERRGDFDAAVRLRFRAGLAALERSGRLARARNRTTGSIARELHAAPFDVIAPTFDAVAYGKRTATAADVEGVRHAWRELLERRS